ncbi:alpha-amylase family glycosyl hydrolase [Salana multivorans]
MNLPLTQPATPSLVHPEWCRNASIYQVNTRQLTQEGTLAAAAEHLPRIKALGPSIVWLMPVHEIGEVNRKGNLGSPYAVRDFYSVGPELGTKEDLRAFVDRAHELGLKVILDWVGNHTSWDSVMRTEHPEFYALDADGNPQPTMWYDWDDIIDLDYNVPAVADYMVDAMTYWVRELDIDGYRCDTAGLVPNWFWARARRELEAIKPVFMLAEWEARDLHEEAFDASYGWSWNSALHAIAMGRADMVALRTYYAWNDKFYARDAIRMLFVSNHDKNSWEGTEFEQFGDALEAAIVMSVVSAGMPLVYSGQEAGNDRRLDFFDRDPIQWREHPMGEFYRVLLEPKTNTRALDAGVWGGRMIEVRTSDPDVVLAFARFDPATGEGGDGDGVLAVFNLSAQPRDVVLASGPVVGRWVPLEIDAERAADLPAEGVELEPGSTITLPAWGWSVLLRA